MNADLTPPESLPEPDPQPSPEPGPEPSSEASRFRTAARAFGRGLVRLAIILVILAIVVLVSYLILPLAYRELVMPVRDSTARMQAIETQNAVDQTHLTETLNGIVNRLNKLEVDRAAQAGQLAGLQTGLDSLRQTQNSLAESLSILSQLDDELKTLQLDQSNSQARINSIQATLAAPQTRVESLLREVQTLTAMNLLIRAQLNLAENNYGLAKSDLQSARSVLIGLRDSLNPSEQPELNTWIARLDLALNELPASPVLAAGDLEMAYQLLSAGLLPPTPTPGALFVGATPTPFVTETPAPFLIGPSATPTPTTTPASGEPTSTAAPTFTPTASPTP